MNFKLLQQLCWKGVAGNIYFVYVSMQTFNLLSNLTTVDTFHWFGGLQETYPKFPGSVPTSDTYFLRFYLSRLTTLFDIKAAIPFAMMLHLVYWTN